jgi:membrane protein
MTPTQVDQFIGQHLSAMSAVHLAPFAGLAGWWLVSSSFNTMIGVFQETFACSPRNWVHTRLLSLAFALLAMLFIGGFFGLGVIVALAPGEIVRPVLDSLRYFGLLQASLVVASLLGAASFLALLYRYSIRRPDRKRHVWPGAFTATFLGTLATAGLGYYATYVARYALFYGGLAAIVVVLLWLWLWSTAILLGAEINIALEDVKFVKRLGSDPDDKAEELGELHLVAAEPLETPTHTPKSEGNSDGD